MLVRSFSTSSRPALRAAACGGRLRRPSSAGSTSAGSETERTLQPNHRRISLTCAFRQWQLRTGLLNSRGRETVPRPVPGQRSIQAPIEPSPNQFGSQKGCRPRKYFHIVYATIKNHEQIATSTAAIARYGRSLDDRSVHYSLSRCNTFLRHKNVDVMPWRRENRPRCKRPADTVVIGLRKRGGHATGCLDQSRRPI
jgi:hypothetical protein